MNSIKFVNADAIVSLEDYATALVAGMISLQTLEAYHINAWKKGLLSEDTEETSKTICWELRRLMSLYKKQVDMILEKSPLDEKQVIQSLKTLSQPKERKRKSESKRANT